MLGIRCCDRFGGPLQVRIFTDVTFVEAFFGGGRAAMVVVGSFDNSSSVALTSTAPVDAAQADVYAMNEWHLDQPGRRQEGTSCLQLRGGRNCGFQVNFQVPCCANLRRLFQCNHNIYHHGRVCASSHTVWLGQSWLRLWGSLRTAMDIPRGCQRFSRGSTGAVECRALRSTVSEGRSVNAPSHRGRRVVDGVGGSRTVDLRQR